MLMRRAGTLPRTGYVGLLAGAFLLLPAALLAQGFEGVVKQRTFELSGETLNPLFDAVQGQEEEEYDESDDEEEATEEDARRELMDLIDKLLALPLDQVRAMIPSQGDNFGMSTASEITMYLKGSKVRAEMGGEAGGFGYFLMDAKKTAFTLVNPGDKFYVEWTPEAMNQALEGMGLDPDAGEPAAERPERARIRSLGVTKEINGVRAEAYRVEDDGVVIVGWVTDEYTALRGSLEKLAERMDAMGSDEESDSGAEDLLWEKGVPVLIQKVGWGEDWGMLGVNSYDVTEIVSVEQKSLSGDLFKVPAGYTQKTLAELYGQG
jgi:hypothetical protein